MQLFYDILPSPIGDLLIIAQEFALKKIVFQPKEKAHDIHPEWIQGAELIEQAKRELTAYFNGQLKKFTVNVNPQGTPFQKQIWKEVIAIPHGHVCSYQDVANNIDHPKACRAVGRANSQNPIPIIIPCHRVIGKSGKLTGYAGGLDRKQNLLKLEGIEIETNPDQFKLF
ncbi:methylated-DNA--[protein]-cysteine S-methyltransferase [Ancylomarina euxinus]|uniref:Methylated-DNA--protein-cysteine methyltransferase n=1 Tax=Ancylomarina euxinus TaxID=2283627 RepID=A0A425Y456_9BACT|nr:methylated-DNA--[protein]-cysteine S-methyltransferase [Ancylomarina euxinus]MCZ4694652.1 methylated-DNA--[protein]-cysteine S-methyltransferase [Ancylomarina euxinus]MUP14197.1 methylated-DNA--[protein]-cysteine S-methyltransferase [Ancylomarina euxinus]RRG23049.1 methylated-DNA--[protein]-cysteine S-methyltransferase [Ancylomarina euxinus]